MSSATVGMGFRRTGRSPPALRKHKEAEKRRRTRINSHLDKLHRLLHCNPKKDKETLLAIVAQRMRELKRQTYDIAALGRFPFESDKISFLSCDDCYYKEHLRGDQELAFKALLCCEDWPNLLPDLIEVLNSFHLKVQKVELSAIGGRIRNVLFVTANEEDRSIR